MKKNNVLRLLLILVALVVAALFFVLYIFFTPYEGESLDVHYSKRYFELLKKDGLTEEEVRFIDQENERVRLEVIEQHREWKENRKKGGK